MLGLCGFNTRWLLPPLIAVPLPPGGRLILRCLFGLYSNIFLALLLSIVRVAEVGTYWPSPVGEGGNRRLTDEVSYKVHEDAVAGESAESYDIHSLPIYFPYITPHPPLARSPFPRWGRQRLADLCDTNSPYK